jgi:hypothetical protein
MNRLFVILCFAAAPLWAQTVPLPTAANIGEVEAQKIEDRISTVRREVLGKYETALGDLQLTVQKAADLEAALAVRAERVRLGMEQALSEKDLVKEPKALRTLQQTHLTRMQELVSGAVADSLPRLVEFKRQLTVEGKLDDAVAVRQAIERLQNANVPIVRTEPGSIVPAETVLQAYAADRVRGDKTYKGVRFVVRGVFGGFRIDPDDARTMKVFIGSQNNSGWVQGSFNLNQWRYREDRVGQVTYLVLIGKDGGETRLGKGLAVDILGDCMGWEGTVKFTKCDVGR